MKFLLVLSALVVLATTAPTDEAELLDNFDIEAILANDEQRKPIFDCLLDLGPCGDFQKIKDKVVTLFKNKCVNCTPEQKKKYDKVIQILHEKYDREFKEFIKKMQKE